MQESLHLSVLEHLEHGPSRARAVDLSWALEDDVLELAFELPAGCFATALLRELVSPPPASER